MALEDKIINRLITIAAEIINKINSKINTHNSDSTAHSDIRGEIDTKINAHNSSGNTNAHADIRQNYVKTVDKSKHAHGQITQDGKVTTTTSNMSKVVVTESDGTIKAIDRLPSGSITHQDISGKLDKNQGVSNNGKFLKVQSTGNIEPEDITIPGINIVQTKQSGEEVGSINGTKFYCNPNTTYNTVGTSGDSGLMSVNDKIKLNSIESGAKLVSFNPNPTLTEGIEIGTLTIGQDSYTLYCKAPGEFGTVTDNDPGFMSPAQKQKLDGITASADSVSFTRTLNSGTKIGSITINNQPTDIFCKEPLTYDVAQSSGLSINNNKFAHTNSVPPENTKSLYKIKYDAQGHITEGEAIDTDSLYARIVHYHGDYAEVNHRHSSDWEPIIFQQGNSYCGITFTAKVNKKLGLGMLRCSGTVTCDFKQSTKKVWNLFDQAGIKLGGYYPDSYYYTPVHETLNFHMALETTGKISMISNSDSQKGRTVSGTIIYVLGEDWIPIP